MAKEKGEATKGFDYTDRLETLTGKSWKKVLNVQAPYRWNLKRLTLGRTLDVGCGIGRNLGNLSADSVGVDHNKTSVEVARKQGYNAYTVDEFTRNKRQFPKESFDSMLLAHVLEHVTTSEGKKIIKEYLPYIKEKVVVICPQKKGFASDETHINFLTHKDIEKILVSCGLVVAKSYSFPFHKKTGDYFTYNETVVVATRT